MTSLICVATFETAGVDCKEFLVFEISHDLFVDGIGGSAKFVAIHFFIQILISLLSNICFEQTIINFDSVWFIS